MSTPAVTISARQPSRWRCGVEHTAEAVSYPAGHWSEEELQRLRADPMLVVVAQEAGSAASSDGPSFIALALDAAVEALRRATTDEVLAFLNRLSSDDVIRATVGFGPDLSPAVAERLAGMTPEEVAAALTPSVGQLLDRASGMLSQAADPEREEFIRALVAAGWIPQSVLLDARTDPPPAPTREQLIVAAIEGLGAEALEDKANLTAGGVVRVEVVEAAVGFDITATERDAAWRAYLKIAGRDLTGG